MMPLLDTIILGYIVLMALAAALRWRYRTWLVLLLVTLGAVAFEWLHLRIARAQVPAYTEKLVTELRALPWPDKPGELAQLAASFRALGDWGDAGTLRRLYQLEVARGIAGEPPERFNSVAEALAWKPPDLASGAHTNVGLEGVMAERRAVKEMLDVQAPRVSGWPPEVARDMSLSEGSRELAPGVWIAPKPTNPLVGTLRFPISVHNRGEGRITNANLTVVVPEKADSGQAREKVTSFTCRATLQDIAAGETRLFGCALTVGMGDQRPLHRLLGDIEAFRAGELDVHVHVNGELDAALLQIPDAEPLIPDQIRHLQSLKESDKQRIARRNALGPNLANWLVFGAIFAVGALLPGLRGRCLSVVTTLALAFAGGTVGLVAGWLVASHTPGVNGWQPIIAVFSAVEYGAPFVGGMLFGNLVYLRQRTA